MTGTDGMSVAGAGGAGDTGSGAIGAQRREAAPAALGRLRPLVAATLREAVDRLPSELVPVIAYHFGWRDPDGRETNGDGGKALRPTITLLAAEAVGGTLESALPGAAAIELVHNFSLLHDDVMDGDRERRHRPTVWALFGVGQAILAGDALQNLAQELLVEDERDAARLASAELSGAIAEMIAGQAEDLSFESRLDVTEDEVLTMCGHKTGALLSCAAAVGAILGGGSAVQADALRRFGRHLGLAFQAVDDVLGIWGDPAVTGKPAASDVRQHKKSIPVVHALSAGGPGAEELAKVLSHGNLNEEAVRRAVALVEAAGSREHALELARRHLDKGLLSIRTGEAGLRPGPAGELEAIARFVVRRDF